MTSFLDTDGAPQPVEGHYVQTFTLVAERPGPQVECDSGDEPITTTIDTYGRLLPAGDELISDIIDTALAGGTIRPTKVGG